MTITYVAQAFNQVEGEWEDFYSSSTLDDPHLEAELELARSSPTYSGQWRIVERTDKVKMENQDHD